MNYQKTSRKVNIIKKCGIPELFHFMTFSVVFHGKMYYCTAGVFTNQVDWRLSHSNDLFYCFICALMHTYIHVNKQLVLKQGYLPCFHQSLS